jgi:hypothetical protein
VGRIRLLDFSRRDARAHQINGRPRHASPKKYPVTGFRNSKARRDGAVYLHRVLWSTYPRLVTSSFCDRLAYQWVKFSTMSIMLKVVLANICSILTTGQQEGV